MTSTEEFYNALMVRIDRELENQSTLDGDNKENITTKIMIEDLSSGNNPAVRGAQEIDRYANASMDAKINGFYLDESEHSVVVYITAFNASSQPYRLSSNEFNTSLGKLNNFIQKVARDPGNMFEIIHEDSPFYELLYYISHDFKSIDNFYYVLLTNGNVGELKLPTYQVSGKKVDVSVFDIERYRRFMQGQKVFSIDADTNILGKPIPCSYTPSGRDVYDTYCCILPGDVIYRLFDTYHYQLLNSNIRMYLQLKGNINKGIMETIERNPEYFLAYNNGISATASEVIIDSDSCIKEIKNFQIVNGGQTSVSIYNAKAKKSYDVSAVNVMAKITVVKDESNYDSIVKNISRYANTQNPIKFSDFSSNDSYNKKLAELSRSIYSPAIGSKLQTKWYYENIVGSYNNERSDSSSTSLFDKEYPKSQFFSKTDMAAYELSYQGFPAEACKGAQDAYKIFVLNLPDLKEPTEEDFRNLISKKILYDKVISIIGEEVGGQGKAAMARYVVAYFSNVICNNKFELNKVWEAQGLSNEVVFDLRDLVKQMTKVLRENANQILKGVEMYCRMPSTWEAIKKMDFKVEQKEKYSNGVALNPVLSVKAVSGELAAFAISITERTWAELAVNTVMIKDEKRKDSGMCKTMIGIKPETLSEKQLAYALRIVYRFYKVGYNFSDSMSSQIAKFENELAIIDKKTLANYSTSKYYVQA